MKETEIKYYNFDAELEIIKKNGEIFLDEKTSNEKKETLKKWFDSKLREYRMRSESKEFFSGGAPGSFTPEEYGELCERILDILVTLKGK